MNRTKITKAVSALLALACVVSLLTPAFASDIQPRYLTLSSTSADLSIGSSGYASCSGSGIARDFNTKVDVTMTLYQINGGSYTALTTWTATGTKSASSNHGYYVVRGYNYQVAVSITVKNASGTVLETASVYSSVVSY